MQIVMNFSTDFAMPEPSLIFNKNSLMSDDFSKLPVPLDLRKKSVQSAVFSDFQKNLTFNSNYQFFGQISPNYFSPVINATGTPFYSNYTNFHQNLVDRSPMSLLQQFFAYSELQAKIEQLMVYHKQSREALKMLDSNCVTFPTVIQQSNFQSIDRFLKSPRKSAFDFVTQNRDRSNCAPKLDKVNNFSLKIGKSPEKRKFDQICAFSPCDQTVQKSHTVAKDNETVELSSNANFDVSVGKAEQSSEYANFLKKHVNRLCQLDRPTATVAPSLLGPQPIGATKVTVSEEGVSGEKGKEADCEKADNAKDREICKFQSGVTVGYTYDALFVSDGRSKKRRGLAENKIFEVIKDHEKPVSDNRSISALQAQNKNHQSPEEGGNCDISPALNEQMTNKQAPARKVQSHAQAQRYTCNICQKNYATSSNLSRHKQTHRPLDSTYAKKCSDCGKAYVSMPALSMHLLTHKLEHKCEVCGKAFSRPWLLQGHMRSHSGSKPYGCLHCGKAFADRSNLRAHMQTHSDLKKYECTKCGKKFALKSYLNRHNESACTKDDFDDEFQDLR